VLTGPMTTGAKLRVGPAALAVPTIPRATNTIAATTNAAIKVRIGFTIPL